MTDEKNKTPDDEYQFPQDEYVSPESEGVEHSDDYISAAVKEPPEKQSMSEKIMQRLREFPVLKNKRVLIVVGIVIVVILLFRLMESKTPAPLAPTPQPVAQTTPTPQPIMPIEQPSVSSSQIRELQNQISTLQNTINQLQSSNQQLQNQVTTLTSEVQSIEAALKKGPMPVKRYTVFYHLRAVLPDRAWITSNTGKTISVTVGDNVSQYGTVRVIDAQQGIVETSSGRRIVYGRNDY